MKLGDHEVHVWRAALDLQPVHLESLQRTLTASERERAKRFFFQQGRDRFVAARGLLRTILARYLDMDTGQLRFSDNP